MTKAINNIKTIHKILGYTFKNNDLLIEALTHPSVNLRSDNGTAFHYQRLEFLGDSIIGAVISDILYRTYSNEPEGKLAQRKAALVSGSTLVEIINKLDIAKYIIMSPSEEAGGGRNSSAIQENVCEAIIGAIYLDGGFEVAYNFINKNWHHYIAALIKAPRDAKTYLQEQTQAKKLGLPTYKLIAQTGQAHNPIFEVEVSVATYPSQRAKAPAKRKAEQLAAKKMLKLIEDTENK